VCIPIILTEAVRKLGIAKPSEEKSEMQKRSSRGCGSFLFLLLFVFLVLKLAGAIDWSWWWVLSPLWLPGAMVLAALVLLAVTGASIYKAVSAVLRRGDVRHTDRAGTGVLEAEGSEVPVSPGGTRAPLALPASDATPASAGGPAAARGTAGAPATEADGPSGTYT
jgi:hypothetical protein